MKSKQFIEFFKSKLDTSKCLSVPFLLQASIIDDVTEENYLDVKGRLAIKMIIAGVCLFDSLASLKAFDSVVDEIVLGEEAEEGKEHKVRP